MGILHKSLVNQGETGHINFLDITEENVGKDLYLFLSNTLWFKKWQEMNIDTNKLNELCRKLFTFNNIKSFCDNLGELDWRVKLKNCEDRLVEQEGTFRSDYSYVYAFVLSMIAFEGIPTPNQHWYYWQLINCLAMSYNLNSDWIESTTVTMWMEREFPGIREQYKKLCNNFKIITEDTEEIRDYWAKSERAHFAILKAAEYRCKKAYCAILRELYLLTYFASNADGQFGVPSLPAYRVWWHPVIDMVCKADAVIASENDKVIALAVYLDTAKSQDWAKNKARHMPNSFLNEMDIVLSAPIKLDPIAMSDNTIVLPTDMNMMSFRLMLEGNSAALMLNGGCYQKMYKNKEL